MTEVRLARPADLQKLVQLGPHFAALMPYECSCDDIGVLRMLRTSLSQGLLVVAMNGEAAVGCLLGLRSALWFDPKIVLAVELAWWLEPGCRSGTAGVRMVDLFEKSARQSGCTDVSMMAMQNIQPDRVAALYERRGYRLTERVYVRRLCRE